MRVLVVVYGDDRVPMVFSNIKEVADSLGLNYTKMWRIFGNGRNGFYEGYMYRVYGVDLIKSVRKKSTATQ